MAPDIIILKLIQPFNVCKYFNILFGVICRKTMKQEACVRMFSMKQICFLKTELWHMVNVKYL